MKIRLHGTPDELDAALEALEGGFEVCDASRPYPDRAPSTLQRVYVDAEPRPAGGETGSAVGAGDANAAAWMVAEAAAARVGLTFVCRCGHRGRHRATGGCGVELRPTGSGRAPRARSEDPSGPGHTDVTYAIRRVDGQLIGEFAWIVATGPDDWSAVADAGGPYEDLTGGPIVYELARLIFEPVARRTYAVGGFVDEQGAADRAPGHRCVDHLDHIGGWPPYECLGCGRRLSDLDIDADGQP